MGGANGEQAARRLLEREEQLARVEGLLDRAARGNGGTIAIEAAAGLGKSRLLEEGGRLAGAGGLTVLAARGEELERGLPWGLARRLLGPTLAEAKRGSALASAAAAAAPLFDRSTPTLDNPPADAALAVAHALAWTIANLAEAGPLLLSVDDAHWVDEVSLRALVYLLGRLDDLPVALLLALRPAPPSATAGPLGTLVADPRVERLAPAPLSSSAVSVLVEDALGERAASGLAERCAAVTRGNPFYLHELLLELTQRPAPALGPEALDGITPESVSRAVGGRLARLDPAAAGFARAVAVLGQGAAFPHAAELAGLGDAAASAAFDALAAAEILRGSEPLGFVHPLVAQAVYAEIGAGERGELHRAAALFAERDGAGPEAVAVHLAAAGRRGDPWAVAALREAAARALAEGATEAAADWLGRALEEPPPPRQRVPLLAELGRAEATLGRPEGVERLRAAAEQAEGAEERAAIHADLGRALALHGQADAAAAAFEEGLAQLEDPASELGKELRAAWWSAASMQTATRAEALSVPAPPLPPPAQTPTPGERKLLAQLAMQRGFEGHRREEVAALAERAWGDGELLATGTSDGIVWSLVTGALLVADARRRGSPMAFATASYCRAWPLFSQGRVNDSVADAQAAVEARHDGWSTFLGMSASILAMGLVERGDLAGARAALALVEDDESLRDSVQYPMVLVAAGRLLTAEGRPEQALAQLLSGGEMLSEVGIECPSAIPWQADAALAAGLAGDYDQARQLAAGALASARRGGAPTAIARALRAAARAERGERSIELHREALATLAGLPPRFERTQALVDLGAALRRDRRRGEAREPLLRGLEQAAGGGALALAETARVELAAAGARSVKASADGLAALTPSERRVAAMAAAGMTNRAIAQALFVTVKAVEFHLGNAYRKLGINSRRQLEPLLAEASAEPA